MNKILKTNIRKLFYHHSRPGLILLFLIILFSKNAFAQNEFPPGSPYTAFGIGDLQFSGNLRAESMGLSGIGLLGNNANDLNPAANSNMEFTNITLGFKYSFLKSSSVSESSNISNGNVTGVNIGIPFNKNLGWTLILGFNPISQINYKITNTVISGTESYNQLYAGNGGVSRINIGMSYKFFNTLSLGAEYNYSFGNIKKLTYLDFGSPTISNSYLRSENNLSGSFFKGGFMFDIGKIISSKSTNDFILGAFYQSKLNLISDVDKIYRTSLGYDSVKLSGENLNIPSSYGFGLSKKIGKQIILSGDILLQDWSNYQVPGATLATYGNSYRMGLGMEIIPLPKSDNTFWENLTYRFGGFYDKAYYTVNGNDINGFKFSIGLGIPLNKFNSIDFGISYSIRGKTDNGLIRDQYLKFTAGLNFGEIWFIKSREEE